MSDLQKLQQTLPQKIASLDRRMAAVWMDMHYIRSAWESVSNEERAALGEELLLAVKANVRKEEERYFGDYQGFRIYLPERMMFDKPYIRVRRDQGGGTYEVEMKELKAIGVTKKLDHLFQNLDKRYEGLREKQETYQRQIEDARREIELGNPYDAIVLDDLSKLEEIDYQLRSME